MSLCAFHPQIPPTLGVAVGGKVYFEVSLEVESQNPCSLLVSPRNRSGSEIKTLGFEGSFCLESCTSLYIYSLIVSVATAGSKGRSLHPWEGGIRYRDQEEQVLNALQL